MDKCGICHKPADQLFETGTEVMYACFKCQPLVPEVTINDNTSEQQNVEEGSDNEPLYCHICNKVFDKSVQLQNHLRNHRAGRRFICTYCNKAFSQSNNLRAHLRIHTNERPYKCNVCGKAFTQVTNLNNHVRLHTGERPYACPEPGCNMAYAQVTNLNQHRKRHVNGQPVESAYQCTECGELFQQRNHMYNHRRLAHGAGDQKAQRGQRGQCGTCGRACGSERALRDHRALHHPGRPDSEQPDKPDPDHTDPDTEPENEQDADSNDQSNDSDDKGAYACVFSMCAMRFGSPREHTEHLLRAHQLRVLSSRAPPSRRGRPPKRAPAAAPAAPAAAPAYVPAVPTTFKASKSKASSQPVDPLAIDSEDIPVVNEVTISRQKPRFVPKLKIKSLFN